MSAAGTAVGVIAGAFVLGALARANAPSTEQPTDDGGDDVLSNRQRVWAKLRSLPQLTDTQRYFVMLTAYGEGDYSPGAHNQRPKERAAARRAVENSPTLVQRAMACGVSKPVLEDGSWGMFQRLGPYLSGDAFEIFGNTQDACYFADPRRRDMDFQILSAIETAHDLGGYDAFLAKPTVGNLRLGWAAPTLMGYITKNSAKLAKYRAQAEHERLPPGLVDMQIGRFPKATPAMYGVMRNAA